MPSDIVTYEHPAPVMFVPRRGRNARLAIVPVSTPVRIPEVGPGEMVRSEESLMFLYGHDGGAWARLPGRPWPDLAEHARTEMAAMGARPSSLPDPFAFARRTPLVAERARNLGLAYLPAGTGSADVLLDGRERAARDMAAFAERDMRRCMGDLYLRIRGPLGFADLAGMRPGAFVASPFLHGERSFPVAFASPGRIGEVGDMLKRHGVLEPGEKVLAHGFDGIPTGHPDDDLLTFSNQVVADLAEAVSATLSRLPAGAPMAARAREALTAAMPYAGLGLIGCVRIAEAPGAAESAATLEAAHDALREANGLPPFASAGTVAAYAREVLMPALAPAVMEDDEMALSGLGRGP